MESGKIDIDTEVKGSKEPVATYKSIPEDDSVLAFKESLKDETKMAKLNGDTDIDDGADELMLKDTGKKNSSKDATEVIFIPENGDAKIDIEVVKQALTGMGKEELMKFANDPFWIKLRWFMFIAFWVLWMVMLAGAIAIVIMAPKCPPPEPRKLWEESPMVRLDPLTIPNYFKGLGPLLKELKGKNVRVISIGPIFETSEAGDTVNFRGINPKLGNMTDFVKLVKAAEENEQEIILEIDPNHTSDEHPWFQESMTGVGNKSEFYIWQNGKTTPENLPPNNWLSVHDGSAWEFNANRSQYYLHQFKKSQPDLNYDNPAVVEEFSDILKFWLKLGVTGFRLANTRYLLENITKGDESRSTLPSEKSDQYESLNHAYTRDLSESIGVLKKWKVVVSNNTSNKGIFTLQEDTGDDILAIMNNTSSLIDLPQKSQFLYKADANISASAIQVGVNNSLKAPVKWPAWNLNDPQKSLSDRISPDVAESLTLMTLLLPGTPILTLNQTQYPAFQKIAELRKEPAFHFGDLKMNVSGSIFIYTRIRSGNPGYLVAYHSGNNTEIMDLTIMNQVPDEVNVVAHSSNYKWSGVMSETSSLPSNKVGISPKSTLVVRFTLKGK